MCVIIIIIIYRVEGRWRRMEEKEVIIIIVLLLFFFFAITIQYTSSRVSHLQIGIHNRRKQYNFRFFYFPPSPLKPEDFFPFNNVITNTSYTPTPLPPPRNDLQSVTVSRLQFPFRVEHI